MLFSKKTSFSENYFFKIKNRISLWEIYVFQCSQLDPALCQHREDRVVLLQLKSLGADATKVAVLFKKFKI